MIKAKISVIIPVYNAEKTIGNIINKLITQKYKNIEIIAINDGSVDDSLEILRKFAKKDNRVVVINQKDAGASAARNAGIKKAAGKFITFIDSDDDISDELIYELARCAKGNTDFVMCGMNIGDKRIVAPSMYVEGRSLIVNYVLKSLLTKNLLYGPYCKLFRRAVVIDNKVAFPEDVNYGEDTIFVLNYLCCATNFAVIGQSLYRYNFQPSGLAANNAAIASFRNARSRALNNFILDTLSLRNVIVYVALRARWGLAYVKRLIEARDA